MNRIILHIISEDNKVSIMESIPKVRYFDESGEIVYCYEGCEYLTIVDSKGKVHYHKLIPIINSHEEDWEMVHPIKVIEMKPVKPVNSIEPLVISLN